MENKRGKKNLEDIIFNGKIPPQAMDLEEAVLGAMMLEKSAPEKGLSVLKEDYFYSDAHRLIFKAIAELFSKSKPIDILTVTAELRRQGNIELSGGAFYVTQLTNRVASAANIEYHASIVYQKYVAREMIQIAGEIGKQAFEDTTDPFELVKDSVGKIERLTDLKKTVIQHISKAGNKVFEQMEKNRESGKEIIGLESSLKEVNKHIQGYSAPDLIIIGGRPGEGKTTFLVNEFYHMACKGIPVLMFSLEMDCAQIVMKILSSLASVKVGQIRSGKVSDDDFLQVAYHTEKSLGIPFHIVDAVGLTPMEIKAISKKAISELGIQIIGVDFLQACKPDQKDNNRANEVSAIARGFKNIAKELNIPVIALAQLSRLDKSSTYRLPILNDLKESSGIEEAADIVGFVTRPHYHGATEVRGFKMVFGEHDALLIFAKYRLGQTGPILIAFNGAFNKFSDWTKDIPYTDYTESVRESEKLLDQEEQLPF